MSAREGEVPLRTSPCYNVGMEEGVLLLPPATLLAALVSGLWGDDRWRGRGGTGGEGEVGKVGWEGWGWGGERLG